LRKNIPCLREQAQALRQTLTPVDGSGMPGCRDLESADGPGSNFLQVTFSVAERHEENEDRPLQQYFQKAAVFS